MSPQRQNFSSLQRAAHVRKISNTLEQLFWKAARQVASVDAKNLADKVDWVLH